jgi:hypothetical protein
MLSVSVVGVRAVCVACGSVYVCVLCVQVCVWECVLWVCVLWGVRVFLGVCGVCGYVRVW